MFADSPQTARGPPRLPTLRVQSLEAPLEHGGTPLHLFCVQTSFPGPEDGRSRLSGPAENRGESAYTQRHGAAFTQADAVAVAAAAAAAATAFAATVSLPLSLCRLWEPPYCPGGTGFPGQKTTELG